MSLSNPVNPPIVNEAVAKRVSTGFVFAVDENQTKVNQLHGINTAGSTGAGIPKQVFGVATSVIPSSSGMTSVITVTFQRNPSDRTFTGVVVFIKGYQGNQNPVQMAHSATSPVQFTVNNTGENLSLSVQAIGNAGRAPIASAPIAGIKLPFSALGGAGSTTQTNANSLGQLPGTLDNIQDGTSYAKPIISRISAGKPLIDFAEAIHLNKTIDNVPNGTVYRRIVTGSTGQNSLDNATFQAAAVSGSGDLVAEWTQLLAQGNLVASIVLAASLTPKIGAQSVAINMAGSFSLGAGASISCILANDKLIPVAPGDTWLLRGWFFNAASALPAGVTFQVQAYARLINSDGSNDFNCTITRTTSDGAWTQYSASGVLATPVAKQLVNARIELNVTLTNTTGSPVTLTSSTMNSRLSCNQLEFIRLASLDQEITDGSTYGRTLLTALTSGSVDPSKAGVLMKGSVAPSLSAGFSYTSTTTTITWSWFANQVVYRADGTKTIIGAGTQTITGLLANNTYFFYPYFDEVSQTLKFLQASDITIPTITGVLLNGTTQFIQTATAGLHPDPGASAVYSVEFWIKTTTVTSEGLLSFSAPQGSGAETAMQAQIAIGGALGEITFAYANTVPTIKSVTTSGASANDGAWHHVLISFATGGTVTIYVDGTSRGSGAALGAQGTAGANCWWHIGMAHGVAGWPVTTTTFLNGSISHVAIYNTALNANQVAAHVQSFVNIGSATYDTAVTNDSPSFYWKLIETSGTNAADSAGTNTGTYQNAPTLNQTSNAITVLGTPVIAWPFTNFLASQGQNAQNRVPLSSGAISGATPTSGTGGGTGGGSTGGGSRGGCFSPNTRVVTQCGVIPICKIKRGDLVLTARGTYRPVQEVLIHDGDWSVCDMGNEELVTTTHSLLADTWQHAIKLLKGAVHRYIGPVWNLEMNANDDGLAADTEHSFVLANGWKAHNVLPK